MDTIAALATAPGRAGVAVVRVSGPEAFRVCERLIGDLPPARYASLRDVRAADGAVLDQALVLRFDAGRSFTGEPVVEFHLHGGRAVIDAVLREVVALHGVRFAEPGEFTRRAFEAGRLSLVEVEGLGDLLAAETDAQRQQAMRVMVGAARELVEGWRGDLLTAMAMITAALDFSDEDLPDDMSDLVRLPIERVLNGLRAQLAGARGAERIRDGFEVAIVGAVNTGKSSLLNALAGRQAAITSEYAGTTRDVIEVRMDLGGLPVTLIDTAGLRETADPVERIGIDLGQARAVAADMRIYLRTEPGEQVDPLDPGDMVVTSKVDLTGVPGISVKTGVGLDDLLSSIVERLNELVVKPGIFAHQRQLSYLEDAFRHLESAADALSSGAGELIAEDIRLAVRALDGIVGRIETEDVLGAVFSSFCIGK